MNTNAQVPICAIGADHALERVNQFMKLSGGLIGVMLNASARTRFFLVAPEQARLADEDQTMAGVTSGEQAHHHELTDPVRSRRESNVLKLTTTIAEFINPLSPENNGFFNIVTKAIMPEKVTNDLSRRNDMGKDTFELFVSE